MRTCVLSASSGSRRMGSPPLPPHRPPVAVVVGGLAGVHMESRGMSTYTVVARRVGSGSGRHL